MVRTRSVALAVVGTFVALSNTQMVVQGARLQRRRAFHKDEEVLPTDVSSYEEQIAAQMVWDDPKRVQSEVEFEEALLDAETWHLQEQQRALEGMVATVQTIRGLFRITSLNYELCLLVYTCDNTHHKNEQKNLKKQGTFIDKLGHWNFVRFWLEVHLK